MRVFLVLATLLFSAFALKADEVHLKNGNIHHGKLIAITDKKVILDVLVGDNKVGDTNSYMRMEIEKRRIRKVVKAPLNEKTGSSQPPVAKPKPDVGKPQTSHQDRTVPRPDPKPVAKPTPQAKPAGNALKLPEFGTDPAMLAQMKLQLQNLNHDNKQLREKAEQQLIAMGDLSVPLLLEAAHNREAPVLRREAIRLLGAMGRKDAVKMLIGFLKASDKEAALMEAAYEALKTITGKKIPFSPHQSIVQRQRGIKAWDAWFQATRAQYPEQYGLVAGP